MLRSRKPIPLARSIRWVPAGMFTPPRTIEDLALFITQAALREVFRHLRFEPGRELLGFLLGELHECPETGARYVVIDATVPTKYAIREETPVRIPEEEWLGVQMEVRRRHSRLIGWYHGSTYMGPRPARLDLETHRAYFPEPWQCGLVVVTGASEPAGAFFRAHLAEPAGGGVFVPFHELLDDDVPLAAGERKPTLIDWENYQTSELIERQPAPSERRTPPRPVSPPAAAAPAPAARAPEAAEPAAAPAAAFAAPLAEPAEEREEPVEPAEPLGEAAIPPAGPAAPLPLIFPSPAELEAMAAAAQPPPRRSRAGVMLATLVVGLAAAAGAFFWYRARLAELPPAGGFLAPVTAATPPSGDSVRPAVIAPGSTATPRPESAAAGAEAGLAEAQPTPSTNPSVLRFDSLADTLERAIRNFHDRGTDFALNRLTCDGLAVGYHSTDVAFISLASLHRAVRDTLDPPREARYQNLVGEMKGVNQEFDASRCARP